jgi:hypothetical protein
MNTSIRSVMSWLKQVQDNVGKSNAGVYTSSNSRGALSYATTCTHTKHLALEMVKGDVQNQNTKKHEHWGREELVAIVKRASWESAFERETKKNMSQGLLSAERREGRGNWSQGFGVALHKREERVGGIDLRVLKWPRTGEWILS